MGRSDDDDDEEDDDEEAEDGLIDPALAEAAAKLGISLIASLLLAGPALLQAAQGQRDLADAATWYLLSFLVSRIGVGLVFGLYNMYRLVQEENMEKARIIAAAEERASRDAASGLPTVSPKSGPLPGGPAVNR